MFILCQYGFLGAMELELKGGVNNMAWQPEKTTAAGNFEPFMFINGKLSLRGEISRAWAFNFNIERENLFQNTVDFRLNTISDYFGFEFGVFTGITDSFGAPDMGILGSMEVIWPGVLFISIGGSSSIGTDFTFTGDNFRESAEAKLGFWLPFAIPVLSAGTKSYTENTDSHSIRNNLIRYQLSVEFFGKTSPVTLQVDGGYQTLSRVYLGKTDAADELSSFFAGLDFQFSVSKYLRFIIGGEMPFLLTAAAPLTLSNETPLMYKAYGGFIINFF